MFGSVYPWAFSLIEFVAALMWGAWLLRICVLEKGRPAGVPNGKLLIPVFLFLGLLVLQLLPLPPGVLKALSPKTASLYESFLVDADSTPSSLLTNEESQNPTNRATTRQTGVDQETPGIDKGESAQESVSKAQPPPPLTTDETESRFPTPAQDAKPLLQLGVEYQPNNEPAFSNGSQPGQERALPGKRSLTLSRKGTRTEAMLFLTYLGLFFLLLNYKPEGKVRDFLKRTVAAIVVTGILVAFIGIVQRLLGADLIYGLWKPQHELRGKFMGPYVNPNHFAGYLEMVIPLIVALFFAWAAGLTRRSSGKTVRLVDTIQSPEYNQIALGLVAVVLVLAALFTSLSRAGIFSFLLTLFILAIVLGRQESRYRPERWKQIRGLWWSVFFVCFALFCFLGLVAVALKTGSPGNTSKIARLQVWQDAWMMFQSFPLFGIGLNSFSVLSPYFMRETTPFLFTHVENDYLQILVETGLIGLGLVSLFFLLLIRETTRFFRWKSESFLASRQSSGTQSDKLPAAGRSRRYSNRGSQEERPSYPLPRTNFYLFWGCVASLLSIGIHSLADFNLRIPANGLLFFLLLALPYRLLRLDKPLFSFRRRPRIG